MEDLKYYNDLTVPIFMTHGVKDSLPCELTMWMLTLAFERSVILHKKEMNTSYMQVYKIKSEKMPDGYVRYIIEMEQEQPDYTSAHKAVFPTSQEFNGTVWLMESWNGKTENIKLDDHYITMLLPEEY